MHSPNSLKTTAVHRASMRHERNSLPMAATSKKANLQDDGRSFRMTGFETITKIFRVALLALVVNVAMGASMAAQSLNPVPWPAPTAVPPAPIQEPAYQTRPAGVLL